MKSTTTLFLIGLFSYIECQSQTLIDTSYLFIISESGLKLRESPNLESATIIIGEYGEAVKPIEIDKNAVRYIDDRMGYWIKVQFKKKTGFMFSGYLSRLRRPNDDYVYSNEIEIPIYALERYFSSVLFKTGEKRIKIIKSCGNDSDCKNGIFKDTYKLNKGFELIDIRSWDALNKRIVGDDWSFSDAIDIVVSILKLAHNTDFEIKKDKKSVVYWHSDYTIKVEKIGKNKTSIQWETTN